MRRCWLKMLLFLCEVFYVPALRRGRNDCIVVPWLATVFVDGCLTKVYNDSGGARHVFVWQNNRDIRSPYVVACLSITYRGVLWKARRTCL